SATLELASQMNQVQRSFHTGQDGAYVARELPFGLYPLRVSDSGFVFTARRIDVRSEVPLSVSVTLGLAPVQSRVEVTDSATLIDPKRAGTVYSLGPGTISEQLPAQMGRSVTDAVDSEPGWL